MSMDGKECTISVVCDINLQLLTVLLSFSNRLGHQSLQAPFRVLDDSANTKLCYIKK